MPASPDGSPREILIDSLARLPETERKKLRGPNWAAFAEQKVRSLREARKWVLALGATMGLFAIAVPTTAFYHLNATVEAFSFLGFLGAVAGTCLFAGAQAGWAVYMYMNWRRQLRCYQGLRALARTADETDAA